MNRRKVELALLSWLSLLDTLPTMNEEEIQAAIDQEMGEHVPRKTMLVRMHQKLGVMKRNRERKEILK